MFDALHTCIHVRCYTNGKQRKQQQQKWSVFVIQSGLTVAKFDTWNDVTWHK